MKWHLFVQLVFYVSTEVPSRQWCSASAQDPWIYVCLWSWGVWGVFCTSDLLPLPAQEEEEGACPCVPVSGVSPECGGRTSPVVLLWPCLWPSMPVSSVCVRYTFSLTAGWPYKQESISYIQRPWMKTLRPQTWTQWQEKSQELELLEAADASIIY